MIAERLKEAFKASNFHTQKELASVLDVSPSTMTRFLDGTCQPSLKQFANLCSVLEVSSDFVLGIGQYQRFDSHLDKDDIAYIKELVRNDILQDNNDFKWSVLDKLAKGG